MKECIIFSSKPSLSIYSREQIFHELLVLFFFKNYPMSVKLLY